MREGGRICTRVARPGYILAKDGLSFESGGLKKETLLVRMR